MRRLPLLLLALVATQLAAPAGAGAIVRGVQVTDPAHFPWQVALDIATPDGTMLCGGSLVAPTRVVTAAQCTAGHLPADIVVRAGSPDRFAAPTRGVVDLGQHPSSVQDGASKPRNDVAVLELVSAFDPPAAPIALVAAGHDPDGEFMQISGWGRVAPDESAEGDPGELGTVARTLRRNQAVGVHDDRCVAAHGHDYDAASMACAGGQVRTDRFGNVDDADGLVIDRCTGDTGGPLSMQHPAGFGNFATPADWRLAGVISWGPTVCGSHVQPGVYTDLGVPSLNGFPSAPVFQPRASAVPRMEGTAKVPSTVSCAGGTWVHGPTSTTRRILRFDDPADATPELVGLGSRTLETADVGKRFGCLETAENAGGRASAMSTLTAPVAAADAVAPTERVVVVTQPAPSAPSTTAAPEAPLEPVLPAAPDRTAPTSRVASRWCVRRRCRLLVRVRDTGSSGAVRSLQATLTRKTGRRTRTAKVSIVRLESGLYELRTPRLARARWTLRLRATDMAGNARSATSALRVR